MAGLSVEEVQNIVDEFLDSFNGNFDVLPVVRLKQEDIYGERNSEENIGFPIQGAFHPSKRIVTLVAANLDNKEIVLRTLRHELFGHYGLNTFKPDDKLALLNLVIQTKQEETLKPIWAKVQQHYPNKTELEQAEEVFAFVAEQQTTFFSAAWDKVRAQFQKALRAAKLSERPLTIFELRNDARAIAKGIGAGVRELQTFPLTDDAQFRIKEASMKQNKPYHEIVAERIIQQLEQGTAPWQQPWQPGTPNRLLPINPTTGKRYKGINAINLLVEASIMGYDDQRWLTYNQANAMGAQVRRGEKATAIQYWKFTEERTKLNPDTGEPMKNEKGELVKETIKLASPRMFMSAVFNASQIDNMPLVVEEPKLENTWQGIDRAEKILQNSGARIIHSESNRAFYSPGLDSIHLPEKHQFDTASGYYATALHELGHWTGHPGRLNRDLRNPFGSERYAKEELRAEIASMIIGDELGIGHDPGQHTAYVKSWVRVLRDDPLEIFRAAADAEKIQQYVNAFELQQETVKEVTQGEPEALLQTSVNKGQLTMDEFKPTLRQLLQEEVVFDDENAGDWIVQTVKGDVISHAFPRTAKHDAEQWADKIHAIATVIFDIKSGNIDKEQFDAEIKKHFGQNAFFSDPLNWNGIVNTAVSEHDQVATVYTGGWDGDQTPLVSFSNYIDMHTSAAHLKLAQIQLAILESNLPHLLKHPPIQAQQQPDWQVEPPKVKAEVKKPAGTYISVPFADKEAAKYLGAKWDGARRSWYVPTNMDLKDFTQWPLAPKQKIYLAIPYSDKDAAKAARAKWDGEENSWFADSQTDLQALRKYIGVTPPPAERNKTPQESLADALKAEGAILTDGHPYLDGEGYRLQHTSDKGAKKSIFYAAHNASGLPGDIPAGVIINNKIDPDKQIKWTYTGGSYEITPEQRAAAVAEAAQRKLEREAQQAEKHNSTALLLREFHQQMPLATGMERYAQNKAISVQGLRTASAEVAFPADYPIKVGRNATESKSLRETYPDATVFTHGDLLVPAEKKGNLWSLQAIQPNGTKMFAKNATKQGCYCTLNEPDSPELIAVAEGYSTIRSVEKVGENVSDSIKYVGAFNAGNIEAVVRELRELHPDVPIIVFGDDDHALTLREKPLPNQGRIKAIAATKNVDNVTAIFPVFAPGETAKGLSDFNDLELKSALGLEGLSRQVGDAIKQVLSRDQEQTKTNQQKILHSHQQRGGKDYGSSRGRGITY